MEHLPSTTMRQRDLHVWPRYEAAVLGFRNYWYPVTWSRQIGAKPLAVRSAGRADHALSASRARSTRCTTSARTAASRSPSGRQEFPGTWTCRYHGWTFDLETGVLGGAHRRAGLADLRQGAGADLPGRGARGAGLGLHGRRDAAGARRGRTSPRSCSRPERGGRRAHHDVRTGNWRFAAENGFDDGHAKYLHRYGSLWTMFSRIPAWASDRRPQRPDGWLLADAHPDSFGMEADYPGLGPGQWGRGSARGGAQRQGRRQPSSPCACRAAS